MLPFELHEDGFDGRRGAEHTTDFGYSQRNADKSCAQNAPKECPLYILYQKDGSDDDANGAQKSGTGSQVTQGDQSSIVVHDNARTL